MERRSIPSFTQTQGTLQILLKRKGMVKRLRGARASSIGPSRVLEGAVPELPVDAATPAVHLAGLIDGDSVPPAAREKPHRDVPQAADLHGLVGVRGGAAAQLPKLQGIMGTCQTCSSRQLVQDSAASKHFAVLPASALPPDVQDHPT